LIELLPRKTINNNHPWPQKVRPTTRCAWRHPFELMRDARVTVHESVGLVCGAEVNVVRTKTVDWTNEAN
jgi:hypothetical protein